MTLPVWPSTLPQRLLATLTRKRQPGKVRSPMDTGPAKQRARFTAVTEMFDGAAEIMTGAQLATFKTFYNTTLGHGALSFTWVDPITDAAATLRFGEGEPEETLLVPDATPNARVYRVTLPLEIMP